MSVVAGGTSALAGRTAARYTSNDSGTVPNPDGDGPHPKTTATSRATANAKSADALKPLAPPVLDDPLGATNALLL
jgi:hypothetical protein